MNNRIDGISHPSFKIRLVFKKTNVEIKPYVTPDMVSSRFAGMVTTKEPSFLVKLIFGLKKKVKLPSLKKN